MKKHGYGYRYIPKKGDKFSKWTVIDNKVIMIGKEPRKSRAITCKCECGNIKIVRILSLIHGRTKGCNCIAGDKKTKAIREAVGTLSRTQYTQFKHTATRRDISWELNMRFLWNLFIKQNKKCALSGVELKLDILIPRKNKTNTASLDRIDSTKSYTKKNVQWVHKDINKMKSNFTDKEFIELCTLVYKYNNKKLKK